MPRPDAARHSRTASPRWAGALSQITFSGPECVVPDHLQWPGVPLPQLTQEGRTRSGIAVALQFHPLHLPSLQAHPRLAAVLLASPWAGRVHQRRFTLQHPLAPKSGICPIHLEVGLVGEENLGPGSPHFLRQGGVLRHEGLPLPLVGLDQSLLGTLQDEPQPMQIVQANRC